MGKMLKEVNAGEVIEIAGFDFIKFYDEDGKTVVVAKDSWFNSFFGNNNNFAESEILKKLKEEFLPKIEAAVGAENVLEHEVDLLSLDGSDKWGKVKTKISLPTFDFYRKHVKTFDKYKLDRSFWLSTPETTTDHYSNDYWVTCVAPGGDVGNGIRSYGDFGVRPFLIFVSSISVSCEE